MTKKEVNDYHIGILKKILNMCRNNGIDFDKLDDATIGMHSFTVEGLLGFMNPRNITAVVEHTDPATGKVTKEYFPTIKSGITDDALARLGARYRALRMITPNI